MKDWITQRSTWLGFGSAIVAALAVMATYGKIDPMWPAAVAAALSAFGLKINDKGNGKSAVSVLAVMLLGSALITSGCAAIQEKRHDDRFKQCTGICLAIEGAKCWKEPTFMDGLKSASDVAGCLDACQTNFQLISKVDFACLSVAEGCEKLEKCVEFEAVK